MKKILIIQPYILIAYVIFKVSHFGKLKAQGCINNYILRIVGITTWILTDRPAFWQISFF